MIIDIEPTVLLQGWDVSQKVAGVVAGLLGIAFGLQKAMSHWKKGEVEQSKISVEKTVIDTLHEEFLRINVELIDARNDRKQMNEILKQQTMKMSRMEILITRMYSLLTHNNIDIPVDIQQHLNDLVEIPK